MIALGFIFSLGSRERQREMFSRRTGDSKPIISEAEEVASLFFSNAGGLELPTEDVFIRFYSV